MKRQNFFIPAEKEEYLNTVIFVFFLNFLNSIVILSTVCGNCGIKTFIYHSFCLREREWSFYWTFNYISLQLLCLLIAYVKNLSEHWTPSVMVRIGFWNDYLWSKHWSCNFIQRLSSKNVVLLSKTILSQVFYPNLSVCKTNPKRTVIVSDETHFFSVENDGSLVPKPF